MHIFQKHFYFDQLQEDSKVVNINYVLNKLLLVSQFMNLLSEIGAEGQKNCCFGRLV